MSDNMFSLIKPILALGKNTGNSAAKGGNAKKTPTKAGSVQKQMHTDKEKAQKYSAKQSSSLAKSLEARSLIDPILYPVPEYKLTNGNIGQYEQVYNRVLYDVNRAEDDKDGFNFAICHEVNHYITGNYVATKTAHLSAQQKVMVDWAEEARAHFVESVGIMNTWAKTCTPENPKGDLGLLYASQLREVRKKIENGEYTAADWKKGTRKQEQMVGDLIKGAARLPEGYKVQFAQSCIKSYDAEKSKDQTAAMKPENYFNKDLTEALRSKFKVPQMIYSEKDNQLHIKGLYGAGNFGQMEYTDLYPLFEKHIKEAYNSAAVQGALEQVPEQVAKDLKAKANPVQTKDVTPHEKAVTQHNKRIEKQEQIIAQYGYNPYETGSKEWHELNDYISKYQKLPPAEHLSDEMKQTIIEMNKMPICMDKYSSNSLNFENELMTGNNQSEGERILALSGRSSVESMTKQQTQSATKQHDKTSQRAMLNGRDGR